MNDPSPNGIAPQQPPAVEVAAGLVYRDRRLLISQRQARDHLGGFWEFPGGKREQDETFEECLTRELQEELGIEVAVGELFEAITFDYPGKRVLLRFYLCQWLRHEPRALGCQAFAWVTHAQLKDYSFPPADAALLARLGVRGEGRGAS